MPGNGGPAFCRDCLSVMMAPMQDEPVSAVSTSLPSGPSLLQRVQRAVRLEWPVWLIALGVFANGSLDIMVVLTLSTMAALLPSLRWCLPLPRWFSDSSRPATRRSLMGASGKALW